MRDSPALWRFRRDCLMKSSITEIWSRVLDGDAEAWEELVSEFTTLVYSVALRRGLDQVDAEDCTQQTWLALYTSRNKIRDAGKLPNWLTSTAYRRAMRMHRSRYAHERAAQNIASQESPISPDEHLILIQRRAKLEQALEMLNERCRILLHALFFSPDPKTYDEISKKLRIPLNSLGPTRKRCLEKLRKILSDSEEIWY